MNFSEIHFLYPYFALLFIALIISTFFAKKSYNIHLNHSIFGSVPKTLKQSFYKIIRIVSFWLAIIFITIGAMAPVKEITPETDNARSIFLVIDTSFSMRESDFYDGLSAKTRMEGVKKVVREFIISRKNDLIGISVFAGQSYLLSPLTKDTNFLLDSIDLLEPGIGGDGTALGDGITTALERLEKIDEKSKAIVVVTDGASNAGSIQPIVAAKVASGLNVKIHSIGIGDNSQNSYDEKTLKAISNETKGVFRNAVDVSALKDVTKEIEKLLELETKTDNKRYFIYFSKYFAILGLIFLLAYLLTAFYLNKRSGNVTDFKNIKIITAVIIFLLLMSSLNISFNSPKIIELQANDLTSVFAIDISPSMNVKDDGVISRLEEVKKQIKKTVKNNKSEIKKIALVAFAGKAQVISPPTEDFTTFLQLLDNLNSEIISQPGTNIAESLTLSASIVGSSNGHIYLFTDGETDKKEDTFSLLKTIKSPIFTIPVGNPNGTKIPGSNITAKVDKEFLEQISEKSSGQFLENGLVIKKDTLPNTNKTYKIVLKDDTSWIFLTLTLLIIIFIQSRKKNHIYFSLLLLTFSFSYFSFADNVDDYLGMFKYKNSDFSNAKNYWLDSYLQNPSWESSSRIGAASFKEKNLEDSLKYYQESLDLAKNDSQKFESHYNIGNVFLEQNKLDEAISEYDQALEINPNSIEAKTNREIAIKRKEKNKQQPNNKDNNQNDPKSEEEQEKLNQNNDQKESENKNLKDSKTTEQDQKQQQAKEWLNSINQSPALMRNNNQTESRQRNSQWW
jgi:Ca-activated chloride channel family protein